VSSTVTAPKSSSDISPKAVGAATAGGAASLVVGVVFSLLAARHHAFGSVSAGLAVPLIAILTTLFGAVTSFVGAWIPKHVTPPERAAALELVPTLKALAPALLALADRTAPKIVTTTVEVAAPAAPAPTPTIDSAALINELSGMVGPLLAGTVKDTVTKYLPAAA
jgi:hypothetical protein